jgi:hypothetical protein
MIREVVANSLGKKARAKLSVHPVGGEFEGHECVAKQAPVRSLTPSARQFKDGREDSWARRRKASIRPVVALPADLPGSASRPRARPAEPVDPVNNRRHRRAISCFICCKQDQNSFLHQWEGLILNGHAHEIHTGRVDGGGTKGIGSCAVSG